MDTTTTTKLSQEWIESLEDCGFDPTCRFATTDPDVPERLAALVAIAEDYGVEPEDFSDFYQGEVEGYTEEEAGRSFAIELADACGDAIPDRWPHRHIDWDAAWYDLRVSDNYAVHQVPGMPALWWVTRSI